MAKRVTERRLVDVLVSHLRERHATGREVAHYEKRIDVAVICSRTGEVWAIEAKTADWRRALAQAIVNLAAAERSYIALYSRHAHRVSLGLLDEHGVGLIGVGTKWGEVQILKEAGRSPYTNRLAADRIRLQIPAVTKP